MASSENAPKPPASAGTPVPSPAVEQSCGLIEKTLGHSSAFRKVDPGLYVVKQGSSYVMISVLSSGPKRDRALVRVTSQVVSGVRPEASLFRQLLILNGTLRFGAFAYVPEGEIVLFTHSLLGGTTLDPSELMAAVHDVALVADGYDDRIVARYGGRRMQDVIEDSALAHLLSSEDEEDMPALPESDPTDEPAAAGAAAKATKSTKAAPASSPPKAAPASSPPKKASAAPAKAAPARKPAASAPQKGKKKGS